MMSHTKGGVELPELNRVINKTVDQRLKPSFLPKGIAWCHPFSNCDVTNSTGQQ